MLPTAPNKPSFIQRIAKIALKIKEYDEKVEKRLVYLLGILVILKLCFKYLLMNPSLVKIVSILIELSHITAVVMLLLYLVRKVYKLHIGRTHLDGLD